MSRAIIFASLIFGAINFPLVYFAGPNFRAIYMHSQNAYGQSSYGPTLETKDEYADLKVDDHDFGNGMT